VLKWKIIRSHYLSAGRDFSGIDYGPNNEGHIDNYYYFDLFGCTSQNNQSNTQPDQVVYSDLDSALDSWKPVVIYFNEAYCSNCKDQRPIINGIISATDNKTAVVILDRTENKDVAQKFGIEIAPNMVILDS
jgi:thiol-disulfide isomerase/thioredoxin